MPGGRLASLALLLAACASARLPAVEEPAPGAVVDAAAILPSSREALYQQRWILDRAGTEIVFTLVVETGGPDGLRFLALDDLGATLAAGTSDAVTRTSRALPGGLAAAIGDTLRVVHEPPDAASLRPVRLRGSGEAGLLDADSGSLWTADAAWTRGLAVRVLRWNGGERWPERFEVSGRLDASVEVREMR